MRRGTKILAVIAGAALAGWLGWRLAYPSYSWRQKLTVTVVTLAGDILSASSVSEVAVTFQPKLLPEIPPIRRSFRGEAAVLEIPGRGFLFVLLRGPGGADYMISVAITVFQDLLPPHSSRSIFSKLSGLRESREIPPGHYPLMVTFGDIADPKTVRRVDPDDMDAVLGCDRDTGDKPWRALGMTWRSWARWQASGLSLEDYRKELSSGRVAPALAAKMDRDAPAARDTSADCHRLASLTLEIADEPVTEGKVEQVLGWINHLEDYRTDPNNPFTNILPREIGGLRRK